VPPFVGHIEGGLGLEQLVTLWSSIGVRVSLPCGLRGP
jgi:hypothetical protein